MDSRGTGILSLIAKKSGICLAGSRRLRWKRGLEEPLKANGLPRSLGSSSGRWAPCIRTMERVTDAA